MYRKLLCKNVADVFMKRKMEIAIKGPKYREQLIIDWKSASDSILICLDDCIENWCVTSNINKEEFLLWKT